MGLPNKWMDKEVLIESEGTFCYPQGCFQMTKEEFEKQKPYIPSILITEGTDHKEPTSLNDLIGNITDLDVVEIDKKFWLKGMGHFDTEKVSPKFKQHLDYNLPIAGSVANHVDIKDGKQINMLPTHFLMSPDLEPNIPNAGIKNNTLILNIKRLDNMSVPNPELEKLKAENARLVADMASQKKTIDDINTQKKAALTKKLVENAKYKPEELAEKSIPELELINATFEKFSAANPKVRKIVALGNTDHQSVYTLNAAGQSTTFFSEYERLKAENKLGSRVKAGV